MDDLISREKLLREIREILNEPNYFHEGEDWAVGLTIAEGLIEREELAYPKKGKWIDCSDEGYVECPFCHSATNCDGNKEELHYCYSCGADMRESE